MKVFITGIIIYIILGIYFGIFWIDFFSNTNIRKFFDLSSFLISLLSLFISIGTFLLAKSIKGVRIDVIKNKQNDIKREKLNDKINKINNAIDTNVQLSVGFIKGLREFILRLEVNESSLKQIFCKEKNKFIDITQYERTVDYYEVVVILEEILNILEQDHAAK